MMEYVIGRYINDVKSPVRRSSGAHFVLMGIGPICGYRHNKSLSFELIAPEVSSSVIYQVKCPKCRAIYNKENGLILYEKGRLCDWL